MKIEKAVGAMREGGIRIMEVSMTTPGALSVIEDLAKRFAGEVIIGAGTVLDAEIALQDREHAGRRLLARRQRATPPGRRRSPLA